MNLVLKIAAGIVLGAIGIFVIRLLIVGVALDQFNNTVQQSVQHMQQNQTMARLQQKQEDAKQAKLRAQQEQDR